MGNCCEKKGAVRQPGRKRARRGTGRLTEPTQGNAAVASTAILPSLGTDKASSPSAGTLRLDSDPAPTGPTSRSTAPSPAAPSDDPTAATSARRPPSPATDEVESARGTDSEYLAAA